MNSNEEIIVNDPAEQQFYAAIRGEDSLGAVIRTHVLIESYFTQLIERCVYNPTFVADLHLSFMDRVKLACCLGFTDSFNQSLQRLNKLRNEFAHKPEMELSKKRVMELFNILSSEDKNDIEKIYQRSRRKIKESGSKGPTAKWRSLQANELFVLYALVIRGALLSAMLQIDRDRGEVEALS